MACLLLKAIGGNQRHLIGRNGPVHMDEPRTPAYIAADVDGNSGQPCFLMAVSTKSASCPAYLEKGLLQGVLRHFAVTEVDIAHIHQRIAVLLDHSRQFYFLVVRRLDNLHPLVTSFTHLDEASPEILHTLKNKMEKARNLADFLHCLFIPQQFLQSRSASVVAHLG